jgi:hypothetical protein
LRSIFLGIKSNYAGVLRAARQRSRVARWMAFAMAFVGHH